MHNKFNVHAPSVDKRLEALIKRETLEHQHVISSHHKEMQALRDALKLAMDRFSSLFDRNEQEHKDFKEKTDRHISSLSDRIIANERAISEQRSAVESMHEHLMRLQNEYARKVDVDKVRKSLETHIGDITTSHLTAFQQGQSQFVFLFNELKDYVTKLKSEMNDRFQTLAKKIDSNFDVSRIDRAGVLKEVRIYEKTIFIIEKKIENLYTLIERLKEKG
jgi:VIT1/CCC1 family predicted Fe2+/Mn2+ transporter